MADKYTLNWHTFSDHLRLMFKDLYEERKYSDVTLICEDQTQFKAHKIVLSACSAVLKDLSPSVKPSAAMLEYLIAVFRNLGKILFISMDCWTCEYLV